MESSEAGRPSYTPPPGNDARSGARRSAANTGNAPAGDRDRGRDVSAPESRRRGPSLGYPLACAGALILVLGAYSNSLHNSFHFDDSHVIDEKLFIRDLRNLPRFLNDASTLRSLTTNDTYRPAVYTPPRFE